MRLQLLAFAAFAVAVSASAQTPSELPITRVALYKNGVGFFEHAGSVTGDQSVTIDFTSAQLNDVLQSLTAIDLNGGRISGAGYNSTTPLEEQLKTLPLALDGNPSNTDFYNAIRGARVQVNAPEGTITGRLLSIDVRGSAGKPNEPAQQHRFVTVVSETGQVRTFELTAATSVTLLDTSLHTDVTRYLELLASTRSQGLRHLTLLDRGTGARDLRVSYISEVPVWKSTYRILFTDDKQAANPTATLQGWSVVDNTTGSDWNNVHLDLIAGAPQSFIQPLSIPYYARRPEIAIAGQAQVAPQIHDTGDMASNAITAVQGFVTDQSGAVIPNARVTVTNTSTGAQVTRNTTFDGRFLAPVGQPGQYNVEISSPGFQGYRQQGVYVGERQAANLNAQLRVGSTSETITVSAEAATLNTESASVAGARGRSARPYAAKAAAAMPAPPPPPVANYAEAAQASLVPQTSTAAYDDFFEYSLSDPITVRKNESALVPILQTKLPIEHVTLWSQHEPVALRALWVTNSSTLTLDRGSFSIVENGSFGGEGLLDPIHPGEKRLLSYAADQAVHVDSKAGASQHSLRSIVIAKGVLTQHYRDVQERDYIVRNAAPEARTVIIEHTPNAGYELSGDTRPDETLPNAYRFRVQIPAGATAHLKVDESRTYLNTIDVDSLNDEQVKVMVRETGAGDDSALLKQLQPILDAQRALTELNNKDSNITDQLDMLDTEEQRQRSNIDALKNVDHATQKSFVDELRHIEDEILALQKQQKALAAKIEAAEQDLANKVAALQFDKTFNGEN